MSRYAEGTSVSIENSLGEVKRILQRFGADSFTYQEKADSIAIAFEIKALHVMMRIQFPLVDGFMLTETGRKRTYSAAAGERDKECRRRMRSLAAVIKAKLIAVDDGVATIEQEFLPYITLPNGLSLGDVLIPQIPALAAGTLALPGGSKS